MEKDGKVKRTSKILLDKNLGNGPLPEEKVANDKFLGRTTSLQPNGRNRTRVSSELLGLAGRDERAGQAEKRSTYHSRQSPFGKA